MTAHLITFALGVAAGWVLCALSGELNKQNVSPEEAAERNFDRKRAKGEDDRKALEVI